MTRPENWAQNHHFIAGAIYRPVSTDALRHLVARAPHIHAIGSRHSFNGVADSPGVLVDLADMPADIVVDAAGRTVTAGAAVSYGALAAHLEALGWALHNMASLPQISLVGAVATGTHGSGDRLGTLSSAVAALEMVTAGGDLVTVRRGDRGFDGMVVGLGAFGIVTRVTLDIEPSYRMRQDAYEGLSWQAVLEDFDAVMGAGTSVSLFTMWGGPVVDRARVKTRLGADVAPAAFAGGTAAGYPPDLASADHLRFSTPFGVAGPWSERLVHMRMEFHQTRHLQSEYLVPRSAATAAMVLLRNLGARIDPQLRITEIRSMAADRLWLSPAFGADTVGLHFSWEAFDVPAVLGLCAEIEELLRPLGGRPHWGKVVFGEAAALAALYPRMADFRALAMQFDPAGKFRNAFLDRHVFG